MSSIDWLTKYIEIFDRIEEHMVELELWSESHPGDHKLQSSMPFCVDTLQLEEWIQFVFLPKMREYVEEERLPPGPAQITPMAEEVYKNQPELKSLIELLRKFDEISHLSHLH